MATERLGQIDDLKEKADEFTKAFDVLKSQPTVNQQAINPPILTKRGLSISFLTAFVLSLASADANAAILEADDDEELLEKVKRDRKERLERQGVISSSAKETEASSKVVEPNFGGCRMNKMSQKCKGYLQDLVLKLSEVGNAIENNDRHTAAASVFGSGTDTDWV
ncbi:Thylakoid lumenal 16.5 kDa protein [Spatholobus suberectus]|nr:Thylakoid lumenal 16.5 kDa protein [Spatholobus suberectus]